MQEPGLDAFRHILYAKTLRYIRALKIFSGRSPFNTGGRCADTMPRNVMQAGESDLPACRVPQVAVLSWHDNEYVHFAGCNRFTELFRL
jgi:hypothetical protein